ncbi:MAG: hydroxyacid dehydrogenase [Myxococcota bacterium]
MTGKVLVSDKLSAEGVKVLEEAQGIEVHVKTGLAPEAQREIIGAYDALIVRSATQVDAALLAAAQRLKIVVRAGIGVDNIDVSACTKAGVLVENTPAGNAVSAAEHAIALLFALARKIPAAHASTSAGGWEKNAFNGGVELTGKTLGVIGTGNIGGIVCKRAQGLAMKVIAFDPMLTSERAAELGVEKAGLDELLARADAVTLHIPLIDATRNLIDAGALQKMKKGALLVNAARGGIVDEQAVVAALDAKHLGGAAFDVFLEEPMAKNHPFLGRNDIVVTPHLGASTQEAQVRVGVEAAEQVIAFLARGEIANALNRLS